MANVIVKNLPNSITSCNLFCGCIASYMAFQSKYEYALLFIVLGAVFDFFDGMTARPSARNWIPWPTTSLSDWLRLPSPSPCSRKYTIRHGSNPYRTCSRIPPS